MAVYKIAGDKGIVIEFENKISEKVNSKVRDMFLAIEKQNLKEIQELIPAYRSLLVLYDPLKTDAAKLIKKLKKLENSLEKAILQKPVTYEIPVVYGGKFGPDLNYVAKHNNLSNEEVIKIHIKPKYRIYMLGFTPGFPYLGGMVNKIAAPRLENPRTKIPAGSVGIAGSQTGIYPIESPGGWRLIGRTPLRLFDPHRNPPFLLQAGNYLKFVRIDEDEYHNISKQVDDGSYTVKILN